MTDWEKYYLSQQVSDQSPARILTEHAYLLPENGKVLDYACGLAANGCWLGHQGYQVLAWDRSKVAVSKINQYSQQSGIDVQAEVRDLELNPVNEMEFDAIIVSHFLHRDSLRCLVNSLKKDGLIFYQTFSGKRINDGPSNPEFRLKQAELLSVFSDLSCLFYQEDGDTGNLEEGRRDQAFYIGKKNHPI